MGAKSKQKAEENKKQLSGDNSKTDCAVKDCAKKKHWFGVKVVDEDGKPVTDVKVKVELNDGSVVTPGLGADGSWKTGLILDKTTDCKVSFPDLYDIDWWPEGSAAPKPSEGGQTLTAADGDCASSLAKKAKFRSYHAIWDLSLNGKLKGQRPNPNSLAIGDTLKAPSEKKKVVPKAVDKEWKFIIRTEKPVKLRFVLVDKNLKPVAGWDWEATSPVSKKATTGADGLMELENVKATETAGVLKIKIKKPPKPAAPPPAGGPAPKTPPYPPPIKPADFKDKDPPKPPDVDTVEWTLKIGSLQSHKVNAGVRGRLHDFGFSQSNPADADDKAVPAIKNYQKIFSKTKATGVYADIREELNNRFSNP